jgi:hypothetical protein
MFEVSYGAVERGLAAAFRIPEAVRKTSFRSAFANLQKLGMLGPAARVGRGSPLTYTADEIQRALLALELNEVGIPPATVVNILAAYWEPNIKKIAKQAGEGIGIDPSPPFEDDTIGCLGGISLRSGAWSASKGARFPGVPNIDACRLHELPAKMNQWMLMAEPNPPSRVILFNLSSRMRAFHAALAGVPVAERHPDLTGGSAKGATASSKKLRKKK